MTMKYAKPEVNTLGEAAIVIEQLGYKPVTATIDPQHKNVFDPAYDLDE
jgi:hypothetical protein